MRVWLNFMVVVWKETREFWYTITWKIIALPSSMIITWKQQNFVWKFWMQF
ncbi:hypothetical protein LINPERPRIM_LOCUS31438 [Linum perenne]